MSEEIVQPNEEVIKGQLKELVLGSVEETLNELLEVEAEKLTQAGRYERNEQRQATAAVTTSATSPLLPGMSPSRCPSPKGSSFETAIIERYRRRESNVEEALIEMYLAGVSVRHVEDITEALWGSKVSPSTISELNKKAYVHIEDWRNRPLQGGRYPYVYVDGIYLRRNWGGEFENVAILVAIAVNEDGYREVLGTAEGRKEDKASWVSFFQWLRGRGLDGVKLIVGDTCLGMLEAVGEVFPEAKYQRCTGHIRTATRGTTSCRSTSGWWAVGLMQAVALIWGTAGWSSPTTVPSAAYSHLSWAGRTGSLPTLPPALSPAL